jgi:hypothetical protein
MKITAKDEEQGFLLVEDMANGIVNCLVDCSSEVIVIEQAVLLLPETGREPLLTALLALNRELFAGAFAVDAKNGRALYRATCLFQHLHSAHLELVFRDLEKALREHGPALAALSL